MNTEAVEVVEQEPGTPLVIDHGDTRTVDQEQTVDSGLSELEQYRKDKAAKTTAATVETTEATPEQKAEKKAAERWQDPDTGDTYDMRHKVARRIKTVLEDRGKLRGEVEALRRERDDLMRSMMERGVPKAEAKEEATVQVNASASEPDANDLTKYPEGQFDKGFIRDMARYEARQTFQEGMTQATQQAEAHQRHQQFTQTVERWNKEALPEAKKKYADFEQVLERFPTGDRDPRGLNGPVSEVLLSSPMGNDVVYVLGTNEQAWNAYYQQARSDKDRYRVLYHIEAQLMARAQAAKLRTQGATTNAPRPTEPVHSGMNATQGYDWSRTDDPDQLARWKAMKKRK